MLEKILECGAHPEATAGFPARRGYDRIVLRSPPRRAGINFGRACFVEIPNTKIVFTQEGYDEIRRELNEILTVKRPAVVERIREARQLGDLSENFDYQDGKQVQGMLEARIRELQEILGNAHVVEPSEPNGHITVGAKVVVKDMEDGSEEKYTIVGPTESSPAEGKISHISSMGAALIGHRVGDVVSVHTPGGMFECKVISVK